MSHPTSQEPVLSTLEQDGSRHWLRPRVSHGRFLRRRRAAAYALMAIFFVLPFVQIRGKPAILLDILHRRFTLFGHTFLPTDTVLLALFMLALFVSIFLLTALLGRLWCGWACPQTVYMEFLYRPLERLWEGSAGKGGPPRKGLPDWRRAAYFLSALLVTALPAHTFLAYFVGVENLRHWVLGSPLAHPTAFLVTAATSFLMMFDFYYFREQLCILACPYGRFQSVLLDRFSLIVSYDRRRGEPRAPLGAAASSAPQAGSCVDCRLCVATCPTGIDIREGLQMECINCTQCIDACDAVMEKLHRPRGLIRYSSQAAIAGEKVRFLRPRVILYPLFLTLLAALLVVVFRAKGTADVIVMRLRGTPFVMLDEQRVVNTLQIKITNRSEQVQRYHVALASAPAGLRLMATENPITLRPGEAKAPEVKIEVPAGVFRDGELTIRLQVKDDQTFERILPARLLGPEE